MTKLVCFSRRLVEVNTFVIGMGHQQFWFDMLKEPAQCNGPLSGT